jgi:hypothetical protein
LILRSARQKGQDDPMMQYGAMPLQTAVGLGELNSREKWREGHRVGSKNV